MIETEYSFFSLLLSNPVKFLIEDFSIEFENRVWKLVSNGKNSVGFNTFNLYWIDLLDYKDQHIYGKIDEVKLWVVNDITLLVFTSSYSVLNLVRHFLHTEFKIITKIYSFDKHELLNLLNNKLSATIYLFNSEEIDKVSITEFSEEDFNSLFAIEYFDPLIKCVFFISIHGMIKLSYGSSESDVKKVCDELGIFKQIYI